MDSEERLRRKENREEIENELQDRLAYLKEERGQLRKQSHTGWGMAVFFLCAGVGSLNYGIHWISVALIILSVMCYVSSKFDELKSEIVRTKSEQITFLERFVRHGLTNIANDISNLRDEARRA